MAAAHSKTKTASAKAGGKASSKSSSSGTHSFQAEVSRLLHLMIHSVYSDREVFLRELISNAADACDRLRYAAIAAPELLASDPELTVSVRPDKEAGTLLVADNGIGMSRDEMIDNLGTIARSGARAFLDELGEGQASAEQIGQFGVGFYAAFMVADRVEVISRRAGTEEAWRWTSDGTGTFEIEPCPADGDGVPARGTAITLSLREDAHEFLEPHRLERIVRTYSDHISIPIVLEADGETRQLNEAGALWMRPKAEITADQYREFLGHVSGVHGDPALTVHYRAEGRHEYTVLLFVPGERPFDLYDPDRKGRQKLYVRRVFITDDADLLPAYLRFVRGVIDSEDMPLNISREMLQNNPLVDQIRKAVTKRVLSELTTLADSDAEAYGKVWSQFGPVLKEGLYEDFERRDALLDLARFRTTASDGETRTLKDYVAGMKPNQTAIYYITGEDAGKIASSPQLEGFRARGLEVLLLSDPVDSFWVTTALGYEGKPFRSVTQGEADLDAIPVEAGEDAAGTETPEEDGAAVGTLVAVMKQALGEAVSDVRASQRLTESPVCIVAGEQGLDRNLERLLARQKTAGVERQAPVMEINPRHPVIRALAEEARTDGATAALEEASRLLLDQAFVLEGEPVPDPAGFARRLGAMMSRALG